MKELNTTQLAQVFLVISEQIIAAEPRLTEIDAVIGDGDHGYAMKRGFIAVKEMLRAGGYTDPASLTKAIGVALIKTVGGSAGVIFGSLFVGGSSAFSAATADAAALTRFFERGCHSIMQRGKASPGQKTMLDALYPAVQAMKQSQEEELVFLFDAAQKAAAGGVEASKHMLSRIGRSKNFRDRTLGHPDPGAVSVYILFRAFYEALRDDLTAC